MKNKKTFVIVENESYTQFRGPWEEDDRKIKRDILERREMSSEQIDKVIDRLELVISAGSDDGMDGMYDDAPYTTVSLLMHVNEEPDVIQQPEFRPEPQNEREAQPPRRTMLDQYYGNSKANKQAKKAFKRFKSHITTKSVETYDREGHPKNIKVYTVDDYAGREHDSDLLLLDGYNTRLERLSRAHAGDFSPYEAEIARIRATKMGSSIQEMLEKYEEMRKIKPKESEEFKKEAADIADYLSSPQFEKDMIQTLIDSDTEFIETNNYTYNARQHTAENLKTLGKDGEKSVKAPILDTQNFAQRFGLRVMNAMITVRNYTKAPVNKAIGTYVVSPAYRALAGVTSPKSKNELTVNGYKIKPMEDILRISQKRSVGMYRNKPTHRYQARKDYFIEEEKRAIESERTAKVDNGEKDIKQTTIGSLIRLAIVPRWRAITEYRKGNVAVLNAGLADLEQAVEERNSQLSYKQNTMRSCIERVAGYEKEIKELEALIGIVKDKTEIREMQNTINERKLDKAKIEGRFIEIKRLEIDSISTDPLSQSQHHKANKSDMTKVVRGFKTAVRMAAASYLSQYIYTETLETQKTPDTANWIPPETVEKEVTEDVITTVQGLDNKGVGEITFNDVAGDTQVLSYAASQGGKITINASDIPYNRGLAFKYDGMTISGSDGKGFDATVLTNVKLDEPMGTDTSISAVVEEILEKQLNKQFTREEINELIASGQISNVKIWHSRAENGVPTGWSEDIMPKVQETISSGTHTITETITKKVQETIPGRWEVIQGEEYLSQVSELNPAIIAAESALAASEISDLNELLRHTRSQENIHRRSRDDIEAAARFNKEKNLKVKVKGTRERESTKRDTLGSIASFTRNNKPKERRFTYESEKMRQASKESVERGDTKTTFEQFVGDWRDLKSAYDENLIGANIPDKTNELEEI